MKNPNATRLIEINRMMAGRLNPSTSPIVAQCLEAMDDERVSSVAGLVRSYTQKLAGIHADQELSDIGKRERQRATASTTLGNIAAVARKLADAERQHRAAKANAVKIEKGDATETLIDLELARYVRETRPIPSLLERMDARIRTAAVRLPPELSGIDAPTQARIAGSLISAELAATLADEAQALEAARNATQAAIDEVSAAAKWTPRELVEAFGEGWKLPGVHNPEAVKRMAADSDDAQPEAA
jgi:hypothetical protein